MIYDILTLDKIKTDVFYTKYNYIQIEISAFIEENPDLFRNKTVLCPCGDDDTSNFTIFFAQNFEILGLKKLITTSYVPYGKKIYELDFKFYEDDIEKEQKGKIFTLTSTNEGKKNINSLKWEYLEGTGDFRSDELLSILKEADIVVTTPPFTHFNTFLTWLIEQKKQFLVLGKMEVVTEDNIFSFIKDNKMWLGLNRYKGNMSFEVPIAKKINNSYTNLPRPKNSFDIIYEYNPDTAVWFTNIEHSIRKTPIPLLTQAENIAYSNHARIRNKQYTASKDIVDGGSKTRSYMESIEVPFYDSIPSDYGSLIKVPINFLYHYCPDQFKIMYLRSFPPYFDDPSTPDFIKKMPSLGVDRNRYRIFLKHKN